MMHFDDIGDDELRVIGGGKRSAIHRRLWWIAALATLGVALLSLLVWWWVATLKVEQEPAYFEPTPAPELASVPESVRPLSRLDSAPERGFTELRDTTINDIPLRIYIPHKADLSLHVGRVDKHDTTIVYVAQAADIRADNGKIVGAFVLAGRPLAWGLSKRGYCASIEGRVTVGVADNSPLFEEATEKGGYFFRQFPLVQEGVLVEEAPKGKSIRRAICQRVGETFMVESLTPESFHDFAQALVDLGVEQAISLVGGSAYGWAVDADGTRHEFGDENYYTSRRLRMPRNTSYLVWKRKNSI